MNSTAYSLWQNWQTRATECPPDRDWPSPRGEWKGLAVRSGRGLHNHNNPSSKWGLKFSLPPHLFGKVLLFQLVIEGDRPVCNALRHHGSPAGGGEGSAAPDHEAAPAGSIHFGPSTPYSLTTPIGENREFGLASSDWCQQKSTNGVSLACDVSDDSEEKKVVAWLVRFSRVGNGNCSSGSLIGERDSTLSVPARTRFPSLSRYCELATREARKGRQTLAQHLNR